MATEEKVKIRIEADTSDFEGKLTKSQKKAKELNEQKLTELEKQFDKLGLGLKKFTADQVKQVKVTKDQIKNLNLEKDSYFKLNAEMNLNKKILKSLSSEQVKNVKVGGKLKQIINDQASALKKFDEEIGDSFRKVGSYEDAIKKAFAGVKSGIGDGVVALSAFIEVGSQVIDVAASIYEMSQQFNNANVTAQTLFDTVEGGTDNLAKEALKIADRWDEDVTEVLRVSSVVAKQFGIDGKAAMDLIRDGMQRGGFLADDDYLRQLKEYSSQMKNIGLDAEQTISILTQAVKEGVYSDKGLDALKEAGLSIREMTPVAEKALAGIGLSGQTIQDEITSGAKTTFQVIQEISTQMGEFSAEGKEVGAVYADIFKGAGEDAGDFILKLGGMSTELKDVEIQSNAMLDAQTKMSEAMVEFRSIVAELAQGLSGVVDFAADAVNVFNSMFAGLSEGETQALQAKVTFDNLAQTYETLAKKTELTEDEQNKLTTTTEELQKLAPKTLENLDDENVLLADRLKLLDDTRKSMLQNAIVAMKRQELAKTYNEIAEKQREQSQEDIEFQKEDAERRIALEKLKLDKELETSDSRKGLYIRKIEQAEHAIAQEQANYDTSTINRAEEIAELQAFADQTIAIYDGINNVKAGGEPTKAKPAKAKPADTSDLDSIKIKLTIDQDNLNNELQLSKDTIIKTAEEINEEMPPPPDFVGVNSVRDQTEKVKEIMSGMTSEIDQIFSGRDEAEVERLNEQEAALEANHERALERINQELASGQNSAAQQRKLHLDKKREEDKYRKELKKIQKEKEKADKSAADKALEVVKAGIKAAIDIIAREAMASAMASAFKAVPFPYNIIAAPLAGAGAYAAVSSIKTLFADGGVLSGPSHANGGINMGGGQEAEGGEIVLTKGVYASPEGRAQASALNQQFGGAAIPGPGDFRNNFMQEGGVVTPTAATEINNTELMREQQVTNMLLYQANAKLSAIEAKTGIRFGDSELAQLADGIDQSTTESISRDNKEFQTIGG